MIWRYDLRTRGASAAQAEAQMAFGVDSSAYASQQLSMFDDLLAALSRKYDLRDLFQHLSAVICRIVPYDEAQLVLLSEDGSPSLYARTRDGACGGIRRQDGSNDSRRVSSRRYSMSCPDRTVACDAA